MKNFYSLAILLIAFSINAQENIKYQKPSKEILDLVEFERPPSVQYDDDKNYMVLASCIGPSHAYVHVVEFGGEVSVCGLKIKDGDIIHADQHGAVKIPLHAIEMLPKAIKFMQKKESYIIEAAQKDDFDIEKLKVAWSKANSEKFVE